MCIRQAKDADDSDVLRKEIHRKGEPSMRINIQPGDEGDILSSTSLSLLSKSTHDWVNDPSEIKTYNMDVPAELRCIMIFVVISKGYMLVRLTNRTRMHLITRRKMSLAARTSAFSIRKSGLWSLAQKTKTESIRESDDEESTKSD
ncbi:unnamed protein product [Trichobilharzia regenti]|nr:unnamed protein product [Trichobilharzia regenti]